MKEKWAVEARIFNNGKIVAKIRPAEAEEESYCKETRTCDVYIDVFEDYDGALHFYKDYKNA